MIIDWLNDRIAHALWTLVLGKLLFWVAVFFAIAVLGRILWLYLRD